MSDFFNDDENDVSLTEEELKNLMSQVELHVSQKLKDKDDQLLSMQKTLNGFMKSVRVLSDATKDVVKKRPPEKHPETNEYISPYKQKGTRVSISSSKTRNNCRQYQSPYRQQKSVLPTVQISKRNDSFFTSDIWMPGSGKKCKPNKKDRSYCCTTNIQNMCWCSRLHILEYFRIALLFTFSLPSCSFNGAVRCTC